MSKRPLFETREFNKHRGAQSELIASTWLLEQGYDVFRNISQHGMADLVAFNPNTSNTMLIDVKTMSAYVTKDGEIRVNARLSKEQQDAGIKILCVNPLTKQCFFKLEAELV